ncbi:MAG TPA: hypothetical protein VFL99_04525 [Segeticoccus sp.]|uniref:PH-like domain-containing protein n=1 Tax=Segeticoccus sp. TaxID=2706531 RepID=UPI002D80A492|nr:hypothetical protein [Segeticoccus sp.]HET8599569.1 hypothetical protein [Segeticoccus sp.]
MRWVAVGILVLLVIVIYTVLARAYLRRGRRHPSAAVAMGRGDVTGAGQYGGPGTDAWVASRGTYVSTTTADSRYDRVTVGGFHGLGVRAAAVMSVGPDGVVWRRQGADDIRLGPDRIEQVRRDRGMAGKFLAGPASDRLVVITWHGDDGQRYDSGFLPRHRPDADDLVAAVTRLTGPAGSPTTPTQGAS